MESTYMKVKYSWFYDTLTFQETKLLKEDKLYINDSDAMSQETEW